MWAGEKTFHGKKVGLGKNGARGRMWVREKTFSRRR
jgi:hypothetical protein